jgi:hypothetical protein
MAVGIGIIVMEFTTMKKAQIDWEPIIWVAVGICGIIILIGLYKMTQPFWDNLLGGTMLSGVGSSLK